MSSSGIVAADIAAGFGEVTFGSWSQRYPVPLVVRPYDTASFEISITLNPLASQMASLVNTLVGSARGGSAQQQKPLQVSAVGVLDLVLGGTASNEGYPIRLPITSTIDVQNS